MDGDENKENQQNMPNKFLHVKIVEIHYVVIEIDENGKIVTHRTFQTRRATDYGEIRSWLFAQTKHYRKKVEGLIENFRDIVRVECPCDECEDDRRNSRNMTGRQPKR
jgi:hypothetical protein